MELMKDTESLLASPSEHAYARIRLAKAARMTPAGKRLLDVALALAGLALLSPALLLIALLIKLEDPRGPVLFKQERVGHAGRTFRMLKFRSMVVNAEAMLGELLKHNETSGALFKMKNDPRVTRLGRLLRKTSLDELPQLWNVVRGEMSLVGPRPPLPREVQMYNEYEWRRLAVVPGCTGLWQISGRSEIGFKEMVELDLAYIDKQGAWTDIKIIVRTVVMLFGSKGAY